MTLLEKTRRLNQMLSATNGQMIAFDDIAEALYSTIGANVYVVSRRGKVLGKAIHWDNEDVCLQAAHMEGNQFHAAIQGAMLAQAQSNIEDALAAQWLGQAFDHLKACITPVTGNGKRLGSLILLRPEQPFTGDDLVLVEFMATIVGMEIIRQRLEEEESDAREKELVQSAFSSLSYSEQEAVGHIIGELDGQEGLLVASKIADRAGITRSVIVNALRKLESARVLESRSLGMKGTYIRVLNEQIHHVMKQKK